MEPGVLKGGGQGGNVYVYVGRGGRSTKRNAHQGVETQNKAVILRGNEGRRSRERFVKIA